MNEIHVRVYVCVYYKNIESKGSGDGSDGSDRSDDDELAMALALSMKK